MFRNDYPLYFCQLEAIETLIWTTEAQAEYRQGISVQGDGGAFERLCNKMASPPADYEQPPLSKPRWLGVNQLTTTCP